MRADEFDEQAAQRLRIGDRQRRRGVVADSGVVVSLEFEHPAVFGSAGGRDPHAHPTLVGGIDGAGSESATHEMIDGAAHRLVRHATRPRHFSLGHRLRRNRMQRDDPGMGESPLAKLLLPRLFDEAGSGGEQPPGGPRLEIVGSRIVQHAE